MEIEQGKIKRIINDKIIIEMEAGSQCLTCEAKQSCHALTGETSRQIEIPAVDSILDLKEGDFISISFQPKNRIIAAFLGGIAFLKSGIPLKILGGISAGLGIISVYLSGHDIGWW